jgi:hypothetical protein
VRLTEKQWTEQVVDLARLRGWWRYHPHLSKWSEPGWPDETFVRPPRLVLAELKRDGAKLSAHQERVIGLLRQCDGIEVHVWRPADFDQVKETLW